MAKVSDIIRTLATYLPPMLAVAETIAKAIESGDTATLAAIVDAGAGDANSDPKTPAAGAPVPAEGKVKRGPGRPPKSAATATKATAESITALCGTKLAELAGKLDGDEAKARQLIRDAVKGAAGVERVKEVPEAKLQAVYDAVEALDAAQPAADAEEF